MNLVHFLVSGVNGASNGTATFVLRGTASSAASVLYSDFEGTTQPGTNIITLDSNGAAEVYCNAYVDVTIKNSDGLALRTVTVGNSATTTEVISDSFTGTNYSGSPSGVNQPLTLSGLLNAWNDSAGTTNWKVLIGGVSTNLSTAISAFSGLFISVKSQGAAGDGVTDDTTAISSAITAAQTAGGSIVFFPPGTYKFSRVAVSQSKVHLMGSGYSNTILSATATGDVVLPFSDTTSTTRKIIEGLTIVAANSTLFRLLEFKQSQDVLISDCHIDGTNCSNNVVAIAAGSNSGQMVVRGTKLSVGNSTVGINNLCSDSTQKTTISSSQFVIPSGFSGIVVKGADFSISNCDFDASGNSTSHTMVSPQSVDTAGKYLGEVIGCTFRTGATSGNAFSLSSTVTGTKFAESGNTFTGYDLTSVTSASSRLYGYTSSSIGDVQLSLKSRESRSLKVSVATGASMSVNMAQDYGNITINATDSTSTTITVTSSMPPGANTQLAIINNSGSTKTVQLHTNQVVWTNLADAGVASTIVMANQSNSGLRFDCLKGHNSD